MENKYKVQIKGIKQNKNCWRNVAISDTLSDAILVYNYYQSGCCKRILRVRVIERNKVMRYKKY